MMRPTGWLIAGAVVAGGLADAAPAATGAYARLLCHGRAGCKVDAVTPVAPDAGRPQVVVTVLTSDPDPNAAFPGCTPSEHWLVTGSADHPARRQLLASGYSGQCASVGDAAMISTSTFDYEDMVGGGHPDHYTHAQSLSLAPLGYAEEHGSDAARFPSTNVGEYAWSWTSFSGSGSAQYFRCDAAGDPLTEHEPSGPTVRWATIPALPRRVAGVTHLGACATEVDGATHGFTIHGKPGSATDGSFRVALAGHELLVEVTDDHWVGPGRDWTFDDHVELWLVTDASPLSLDKCEDLHARDAVQYGVRIADGAVFAAAGHPTDKLVARRSPAVAKDGQPVMLTITLPDWFDAKTSGLTVVYSDSDDGKTQKRLIATSELQFGRRHTIGRARAIAPREATCAVTGGRLEPALGHTFNGDEPMIGGGDH
jgi:hypothetical protein